jgi:predicted RNase H-like HicB family nuclease
MVFQPLAVIATWDNEAQVWVAESDQIPGLVTEAATKDEILCKLGQIIPELLRENEGTDGPPDVPYSLM